MDVLASTEFRKRFAKLSQETVVTVNGHPIGTWVPGVEFQTWATANPEYRSFRATDEERVRTALRSPRPFTPVPKPSKRK